MDGGMVGSGAGAREAGGVMAVLELWVVIGGVWWWCEGRWGSWLARRRLAIVMMPAPTAKW